MACTSYKNQRIIMTTSVCTPVHREWGEQGKSKQRNIVTADKYSGIYYILSSLFDMSDFFLIRLDMNKNYLFFQTKELDLIDAYNAREATPWRYYIQGIRRDMVTAR